MDRLTSKGQMLDQIYLDNAPYSSFDRRNHNFLSGKLGKLIVSRVDEVYPGDRIKGHVEAVANFEPLASPILGTMVMKQESFYIPDSILWKNAHKFFTGKNGFNGSMPEVSPRGVFNAFLTTQGFNLLFNLPYVAGQFHGDTDVLASSPVWPQDWTENAVDVPHMLSNYGNAFGVLDLLTPAIELYQKYWGVIKDDVRVKTGLIYDAFSAYKQEVDSSDPHIDFNSSEHYIEFVSLIAEFYTRAFDMFFGPSSHLDYMGFPVNDNWREFFYGTEPISAGNFGNGFIAYLSFQGDPDDEWHGDPVYKEDAENYFSAIPLNWMPFRAAYACWYWNYRDELLETLALDPESDDFLGDTPTTNEIILLSLLRVRCWYKDTFTTALTNTGDGDLLVPVSSDYGPGVSEVTYYTDTDHLLNVHNYEAAVEAGANIAKITVGSVTYAVPMNYLSGSFFGNSTEPGSTSGISLQMLDRVTRLRKFIAKKLILGYEYDDVVWSSFMVKLSNVRMRIPELLSRGRDEVAMNTVVNNTTTNEQIAGDKTAVAWASGRSSQIDYFAEEHGWYISFITVLPVQSYLGGLQRYYMKLKQFDYAWPEFATMGMDAVYNYELSAPRGAIARAGLSDATALAVYGYQGRYYDVKSRLDESHGRLRTDLRFMTFSREFNEENPPALNYIMVHCWPRTDMFIVEDSEQDVIRTIDVFSALDFQRRFPVPSSYI